MKAVNLLLVLSGVLLGLEAKALTYEKILSRAETYWQTGYEKRCAPNAEERSCGAGLKCTKAPASLEGVYSECAINGGVSKCKEKFESCHKNQECRSNHCYDSKLGKGLFELTTSEKSSGPSNSTKYCEEVYTCKPAGRCKKITENVLESEICCEGLFQNSKGICEKFTYQTSQIEEIEIKFDPKECKGELTETWRDEKDRKKTLSGFDAERGQLAAKQKNLAIEWLWGEAGKSSLPDYFGVNPLLSDYAKHIRKLRNEVDNQSAIGIRKIKAEAGERLKDATAPLFDNRVDSYVEGSNSQGGATFYRMLAKIARLQMKLYKEKSKNESFFIDDGLADGVFPEKAKEKKEAQKLFTDAKKLHFLWAAVKDPSIIKSADFVPSTFKNIKGASSNYINYENFYERKDSRKSNSGKKHVYHNITPARKNCYSAPYMGWNRNACGMKGVRNKYCVINILQIDSRTIVDPLFPKSVADSLLAKVTKDEGRSRANVNECKTRQMPWGKNSNVNGRPEKAKKGTRYYRLYTPLSHNDKKSVLEKIEREYNKFSEQVLKNKNPDFAELNKNEGRLLMDESYTVGQITRSLMSKTGGGNGISSQTARLITKSGRKKLFRRDIAAKILLFLTNFGGTKTEDNSEDVDYRHSYAQPDTRGSFINELIQNHKYLQLLYERSAQLQERTSICLDRVAVAIEEKEKPGGHTPENTAEAPEAENTPGNTELPPVQTTKGKAKKANLKGMSLGGIGASSYTGVGKGVKGGSDLIKGAGRSNLTSGNIGGGGFRSKGARSRRYSKKRSSISPSSKKAREAMAKMRDDMLKGTLAKDSIVSLASDERRGSKLSNAGGAFAPKSKKEPSTSLEEKFSSAGVSYEPAGKGGVSSGANIFGNSSRYGNGRNNSYGAKENKEMLDSIKENPNQFSEKSEDSLFKKVTKAYIRSGYHRLLDLKEAFTPKGKKVKSHFND